MRFEWKARASVRFYRENETSEILFGLWFKLGLVSIFGFWVDFRFSRRFQGSCRVLGRFQVLDRFYGSSLFRGDFRVLSRLQVFQLILWFRSCLRSNLQFKTRPNSKQLTGSVRFGRERQCETYFDNSISSIPIFQILNIILVVYIAQIFVNQLQNLVN